MPKKLNTVLKAKSSVESFNSTAISEQIMTIEELNEKINGLFELTKKMFITM